MPKCQIKSQETYNYIKKINDYLNDKLTNMFHIYTSSNIDYEIKSNTFNENKLREKDIDSNLCTSNLKVYLLIVTIICYICSKFIYIKLLFRFLRKYFFRNARNKLSDRCN